MPAHTARIAQMLGPDTNDTMTKNSYDLRRGLGAWLIGVCGVLMLSACDSDSQSSSAEIPSQSAAAFVERASIAAEPTVAEDALEDRAANYALIEEASASSVPATSDAALHAYDANAAQATQ